jgi:hypothetical protein
MASVKESKEHTSQSREQSPVVDGDAEKSRWERLWPVIACGAGLFSDGYLNNVLSPPLSN